MGSLCHFGSASKQRGDVSDKRYDKTCVPEAPGARGDELFEGRPLTELIADCLSPAIGSRYWISYTCRGTCICVFISQENDLDETIR